MKGENRICELFKVHQVCTTLSLVAVMHILLPVPSIADEQPAKQPNFKMMRVDEDYSYLRDVPVKERQWSDRHKYISLDDKGRSYLSLGGEIRWQYESFENDKWGNSPGNTNYLLQRYVLHTDIHLGKSFRAFGQFKSAIIDGIDEPSPVDQDDLDLHQGFVDFNFNIADKTNISIRPGRQEMAFGGARLVGLREGPNVRRSFNALRAIIDNPKIHLEGFVSREVKIKSSVFSDYSDDNALFWGAYGMIKTPFFVKGFTDLYYFGINRDSWLYDEGKDSETRHTIGIRRWRKNKLFTYNTEIIIQFGKFGNNSILAWSFYTDYKYHFQQLPFSPAPGIKIDILSGDKKSDDGKLNTFNALYSNPAYFGLLSVIGPANIIDIHNTVDFKVNDELALMLEWAFYWRHSKSDGLYSPIGTLQRTGQISNERYIGDQAGVKIEYQQSRYLTLVFESSYFHAGSYIDDTGSNDDILHVVFTSQFLF